ncbi:hypothetical protein PI124_g11218 [Phytophthora idaei]|nr:hypothetical protein PI125_g17302 [Phytophthora idaei]KAG3156308.1 hypothetical protein PI126_g8815 [Phytophthora idaei]KAG3243973.1 hypothetical protein PI124_g11218 [Phytophthora idaei]
MTTLCLDNTNLLKLVESSRRIETGREERDRRGVETFTKKMTTLETKLQDAYDKFDAKEVASGAQVVAAEREQAAALAELAKLQEAQGQLKELLARLKEQDGAGDQVGVAGKGDHGSTRAAPKGSERLATITSVHG